jgi:hypothetical protein
MPSSGLPKSSHTGCDVSSPAPCEQDLAALPAGPAGRGSAQDFHPLENIMSQLNPGIPGSPQQGAPVKAISAPPEDLQHVNDDAAAARHLTAIRIRGQLAELDSEGPQA